LGASTRPPWRWAWCPRPGRRRYFEGSIAGISSRASAEGSRGSGRCRLADELSARSRRWCACVCRCNDHRSRRRSARDAAAAPACLSYLALAGDDKAFFGQPLSSSTARLIRLSCVAAELCATRPGRIDPAADRRPSSRRSGPRARGSAYRQLRTDPSPAFSTPPRSCPALRGATGYRSEPAPHRAGSCCWDRASPNPRNAAGYPRRNLRGLLWAALRWLAWARRDVEVLRGSRPRVKRDRVRSDQQVPNASCVQRADKLFEIGVGHRAPSL